METKNGNPTEEPKRRRFLKLGGLSLFSLPFLSRVKITFAEPPPDPRTYWEGPEGAEYCVSRVVKSENAAQGVIRARIDRVWREFPVRELEQKFWDWEFTERISRYEKLKAGTSLLDMGGAGPHSPTIATYGNRFGRGDSEFHINCKIPGVTIVPKKEYIKEINSTMLANINIPTEQKLDYLTELYANRELWRKDIHVSLELFSTPKSMTHTFYNLMQNPVATLCYQGAANPFTSFELRCIAKLVHSQDQNLSDEEKDINLYPAITHGYFHAFYPDLTKEPGVIYYHVEEFDNSVGPNGKRVVSIF